jgi:hypothetical protein
MIAEGLRVAILDGTLLAGSVLPTVKEIALRHHVCPVRPTGLLLCLFGSNWLLSAAVAAPS